MPEILTSRNLELTEVLKGQSLAADFVSPIIDFKEMNAGFIQVVTTTQPSTLGAEFDVVVSLLCDETTFSPYPASNRKFTTGCNNFNWEFCCLSFRYARLIYLANGTLDGEVDIYARAKRT
jgi:hypothetical protein